MSPVAGTNDHPGPAAHPTGSKDRMHGALLRYRVMTYIVGSALIVHNRSVPKRRTSTVCHTYRLADHSPGSTAFVGSIRESTPPNTATSREH